MQSSHSMALQATPMARAIRAVFFAVPMLSPLAVHAAAAADTDATMPTITVTGHADQGLQVTSSASNKFTAPLIDTPRTVTVIPAALLKETQAASLSDALRSVPGISFKGGDAFGAPGGDHPSMRGFDSSSSLFIDGMRSAGAQSRETFDIEQIEVVKGPSSVYTGRGSVGGSINIISKTAKADDFTNAGVGAGSDGYLRGTLDANRQLGGNAAGRLNLMWHEANMPGRNAVDYSRWGIAPSVTFGLGGPTQVILSYYHMQSHDMPDYAVPYARSGGEPLDVPRSRFFGLTSRDFIKNTADIAQGEVRHDLGGNWKLRNVTQVAKTSLDYIATNPQWSGSSGDILLLEAKSGIFDMTSFTNQTELTGKLLLGGMQHSVTTGLELSREKSKRDNYYVLDSAGNNLRPGAPCKVAYNCTSASGWNPANPWTGSYTRTEPAYPVLDTTTDTASAYAFDTVALDAQWLLNAGVRFDSYRTRATTDANALVKATSLQNDVNFANYQLGIVYKPAANGSVYASWGTSSNPVGVDGGQGGDAIGAATADLSPERSRNIELGTKWEVLDRRVSLSAAVFQAAKTNARIPDGLGHTVNAGRQNVEGVELGIAGNLSADWDIFAGYTYLDSKVKDGGPTQQNIGKQFPLTPRNSATVWTTYRVLPQLKIGGGATSVDKMYANAANTTGVPGYTRFDAMASYTVSKHLALQFNLYNLTDKKYYDKAYGNYASVAAGRSAVITANFSY